MSPNSKSKRSDAFDGSFVLGAVLLLGVSCSGVERSGAATAPEANVSSENPASAGEAAEETQFEQDLVTPPLATGTPWSERVLYFALLDRFVDGDPSNNTSHGVPECNRRADPHAFQGGDLAGLRGSLGYLEQLGVNALWLSPLYRGVPQKQGANCGFPGYWPELSEPYSLAVDPRYGDSSTFDALLSDAHERDMKVMLDMLVNHAGYGAPLVRQHPEWFNEASTCNRRGQPDIDCPLAGLPDFNHSNSAAADYLVDLHLQWVRRFPIDGIRMDTVKHVDPAYFRRWIGEMRGARSDLFVLGELLDEHTFERFGPYLETGFDSLFNFPLRQGLIASFARGESVDVVAQRMADTLNRFGPRRAASLVNLLDNHDVRRFAEEIPAWVPRDEARRRYVMAMTALLTLPGVPQLYSGDEVGMYGGADPDNRRFLPAWVFNPRERQADRPGFIERPNLVFDATQRLAQLRRRLPALRRGSYRELWRQNGPSNNNVWAFIRQDGAEAAVVVFNNGQRPTDGTVPLSVASAFADGERLVDVLGIARVADVTVSGGVARVALPAQSAVVLVPRSRPHPLGAQVQVRFSVEASTRLGERLVVMGSSLELGGWDPALARPLTPETCAGNRCTWRGAVTVPRGAAADFKFVTLGSGPARWEPGPNRSLVAEPGLHVETVLR
jgi:glycosidase